MPEDPHESTKLQKDVLWGLYLEYRTHARHSETLRSNVNNNLLLAASGLTAVIAVGQGIDHNDWPLSVLMILLGLIGALFSASYTERYHRNRERASEVKNQIDSLLFVGHTQRTMKDLQVSADRQHYDNARHRWIRRSTSAHWFWLVFPLMVALLGAVLTVLSFAL
jgi:hypothetical protein